MLGQLDTQLVSLALDIGNLDLELRDAVELLLPVLLRGDLVALPLERHLRVDVLSSPAGAWVGGAGGSSIRRRRGRRVRAEAATAPGAAHRRRVAVEHAKARPVGRGDHGRGREHGQVGHDIGREGGRGGGCGYGLLQLLVQGPVEVGQLGAGVKQGTMVDVRRRPPRGIFEIGKLFRKE